MDGDAHPRRRDLDAFLANTLVDAETGRPTRDFSPLISEFAALLGHIVECRVRNGHASLTNGHMDAILQEFFTKYVTKDLRMKSMRPMLTCMVQVLVVLADFSKWDTVAVLLLVNNLWDAHTKFCGDMARQHSFITIAAHTLNGVPLDTLEPVEEWSSFSHNVSSVCRSKDAVAPCTPCCKPLVDESPKVFYIGKSCSALTPPDSRTRNTFAKVERISTQYSGGCVHSKCRCSASLALLVSTLPEMDIVYMESDPNSNWHDKAHAQLEFALKKIATSSVNLKCVVKKLKGTSPVLSLVDFLGSQLFVDTSEEALLPQYVATLSRFIINDVVHPTYGAYLAGRLVHNWGLREHSGCVESGGSLAESIDRLRNEFQAVQYFSENPALVMVPRDMAKVDTNQFSNNKTWMESYTKCREFAALPASRQGLGGIFDPSIPSNSLFSDHFQTLITSAASVILAHNQSASSIQVVKWLTFSQMIRVFATILTSDEFPKDTDPKPPLGHVVKEFASRVAVFGESCAVDTSSKFSLGMLSRIAGVKGKPRAGALASASYPKPVRSHVRPVVEPTLIKFACTTDMLLSVETDTHKLLMPSCVVDCQPRYITVQLMVSINKTFLKSAVVAKLVAGCVEVVTPEFVHCVLTIGFADECEEVARVSSANASKGAFVHRCLSIMIHDNTVMYSTQEGLEVLFTAKRFHTNCPRTCAWLQRSTNMCNWIDDDFVKKVLIETASRKR